MLVLVGYLATVLRTCIKTITIIVYKMVVYGVAVYGVAPAQCCFLFVFCNFLLLYDSIICGQFIFLLGRPVSEL